MAVMSIRPHTNAPWQGKLTSREAEVLEALAAGLMNGEIAEALGLTERTIKFHVTNVYMRLNVRNRVMAARWWWEHVEMPKREAA
jgi:DNA-binding NarL/FixJ family response regulator